MVHKETARLQRVNVRHMFVKTKERMNTMGQAVGSALMSPHPEPPVVFNHVWPIGGLPFFLLSLADDFR